MTTETDIRKLTQLLDELNRWDALEFHSVFRKGQREIYLPYIMNDALEYYLIFKNCRVTGCFCETFQEKAIAEFSQTADGKHVIVREGDSHIFTLWFENFEIICQCYQYHRIGHFWVQGQEQWRQLVYMIGTMKDKQEYAGDSVCNDRERALLPLMEFAPFFHWFPLAELPAEKYRNTDKGCRCMQALAMEAGDKAYAAMISLYRHFPTLRLRKHLSAALQRPARIPLYNLILRKVEEASCAYPARDYGHEQNKNIRQMRKEAAKVLHQNDFSGDYPYFQKGELQVFAAEEHPFTVMEAEDFHFRIQYMVSRSRPGTGINRGFFTARGNEGLIFRDLTFLK